MEIRIATVLPPGCPARRALTSVAAAAVLVAAFPRRAVGQNGCVPLGPAVALPGELSESSGLAASRQHPGVFWTHNDSGGEPRLYAVDAQGAILGRVRVAGASLLDWEDLALGPCPAGDCLYIGDIGDNDESREAAVIYRVPEPAPTDTGTGTVRAERLPVRYPDRPQDAEALAVTPGGDIYILTKGRSGPVGVYRYPLPVRPDEPVELELVQQLGTQPPLPFEMVTGADATPDGRLAVRTYAALRFYRFENGRLATGDDVPTVNLRPLEEPQGEAVAVAPDGIVTLTSERGMTLGPASLVQLRCSWR
ncbi:MAG: hypothetical protein HY704_15660 [Gemmatimonadetes bacterium]|nr:hypothetical protein [Gemmatimonadota bacterium]